jgi:hypothetical protein
MAKKVSIGGFGPKDNPVPTVEETYPGMVLKDWVPTKPIPSDNWNKETNNMQRCELCMHYAGMRCRRHAPKGQEGWPAVFPTDWCGDHKMSKAEMTRRS